METKRFIKEKLEFHKRQTVANEIINRATNHLLDAYRELEMALQYCDDQEFNHKLIAIKELLGNSSETSESVENTTITIIGQLQDLVNDNKD